MGFEFLTDDHLGQYGKYRGEPTAKQFQDYFLLDIAALKRIAELRHDYTRLGFAVQLCTLKFLGTFLTDPLDVPEGVLRTLAVQLGLSRSLQVSRYLDRQKTRFKHQQEIRVLLGYRDFDSVEVLHLMRFLYRHLLVTDGRPIELFDLLTQELVRRKVVLPGATVLARIVLRVREGVATRLYRQLTGRLTTEQKTKLDDLVIVPEGQRRSPLDVLRTPPTRQHFLGLLQALRRLDEIRAVGVGTVPLADIPQDRLQVLSRHALVAWAPSLAKLTSQRRSATLLAVIQHLEKTGTDDALDIFDAVMTAQALSGEKLRRKARLRTLKDLDQAALLLRDAVRVLLDAEIPAPLVRELILARLGETSLLNAIQAVTELASAADDPEPEAWLETATTISRFLPKLLETLPFEGTATAAPTLAALKFLRGEEGQRRSWKKAPTAFIPTSWEDLVRPAGVIDPRAYQVCAAYRLHTLLKRREIFVAASLRYGDPRAQLLQGADWDRSRPEFLRALGWSTDPKIELDALATQLDQRYQEVAAGLAENPAVRVESQDGLAVLVITPFAAQPDTESLPPLQAEVDQRLPDIDLSELLMEVHAFTGFAGEFDNASEGTTQMQDFATSLCAVLVAGACNLDLKAVSQPLNPALTLSRLNWVKQQYLRADTLLRANACLVAAQAALPLANVWGSGETASADGLRFTTPLRNTVAAPNSKYFGAGRGITYYALSSDQYSGLHARVIPGTLRDSLYILGNLLEQKTVLKPQEVMSDTAGYSDVVFGLFHLLGYQFSPRIADLGQTRYWRMDRQAHYGDLNEVARHQINTGLIAAHWDDLLRVAASLKQGTVPAPDIMRVLGKNGSLSGLGKAVAELGRIAKTLFLLNYVQDESYRRKIQRQLNRGEARWSLARIMFHGQRGELRQRFREGMEDQLGALGIVINAVTLWNTRYLSASLDWIRELGLDVLPEDVARLSPIRHAHISMLGRYHFEVADDIAAGAMRPLRDPDALQANDWVF